MWPKNVRGASSYPLDTKNETWSVAVVKKALVHSAGQNYQSDATVLLTKIKTYHSVSFPYLTISIRLELMHYITLQLALASR